MTLNVQVSYFDVRTSELRIVVVQKHLKLRIVLFKSLEAPNKTNGIL
jgi:hypothetical protein